MRHGGLHAATSAGSRRPTRARCVFTLCAPDGAFLARVAHPALGILDAADDRRARRRTPTARARWPAPARTGSTPGRPGENVRLVRAGDAASADARSRRSSCAGPTTRPSAPIGLQSATVDGIDAPGRPTSTGSRRSPSSPSPRATASRPPTSGSGPAPAWARSPSGARSPARSIATRWPATGSPPGSTAATHVTPCEIDGGCGGTRLVRLQRPGGERGARGGQVRPGADVPAPHPGPRRCPACPTRPALAEAVADAARDQPRAATSEIDRCPSRDYQADLATGKLDGLSTSAGSPRRSPTRRAFLEPLFGAGVESTAARPDAEGRAAPSRTRPPTADPAARADGVRPRQRRHPRRRAPSSRWPTRARSPRSAPTSTGVVDLAARRSTRWARSRPATAASSCSCRRREPDGAYCGDQVDARRLPAVRPRRGGPVRVRAGDDDGRAAARHRCEPDAEATVWTCRLRQGVTFQRRRPPRRRRRARVVRGAVGPIAAAARGVGPAPFAAWDELFGGTIGPCRRAAGARAATPARLLDQQPLHQERLVDERAEDRRGPPRRPRGRSASCWLPAVIAGGVARR